MRPEHPLTATTALALAGLLALTAAQPCAAAPELRWSTYFNGDRQDRISGVAIGPAGHLFISGATTSTDLPTTPGVVQPTPPGGDDLFVAKLTPSGDAVVWCTYLGGSGSDAPGSIAVHADGRVTVVGTTRSNDLPVVNAFQPALAPAGPPLGTQSDAFVARLTADGTSVEFLSYLGGSGLDEVGIQSLALGDDDSVAIVGTTFAPDFPVRAAFRTALGGPDHRDAFVVRIAPNDTLAFATYLGGSDHDWAAAAAFGSDGSVFVGGQTDSADFPTVSPWQADHGSPDFADAFVARIPATGGAPLWSTFLGGFNADSLHDLVVDPGDQVHVAGSSSSPDFPLHAGAPPLSGPSSEAFVARFTADGQGLLRSRFFGTFLPQGMGLDALGAVHVAGYTTSSVAPIDLGSAHQPGAFWDVVGVKVQPSGHAAEWTFQIGGSTGGAPHDFGTACAVTDTGGLVVGGFTMSGDFPTVAAMQAGPGVSTAQNISEGVLFGVEPGLAPSAYEPSARDARSWVEPFTLDKLDGVVSLDLGWEESMGDPSYGIVVGDLLRLHATGVYDHAPLACDLPSPALTVDWPPGSVYFLVLSVDKDAPAGERESSYGRDSFGVERPPADPPCAP